jgi:hypothetical protein
LVLVKANEAADHEHREAHAGVDLEQNFGPACSPPAEACAGSNGAAIKKRGVVEHIPQPHRKPIANQQPSARSLG